MTAKELPLISVIVPTRNRHQQMRECIALFDLQTWRNKELLILDDSDEADTALEQLASAREDISYWHTERQPSIGYKRNLLIERSRGSVIAHFDDDDYYAPQYLERMHGWLAQEGVSLVKLVGWFCLHQATQTLGYWLTTDQQSDHQFFRGTEKPSRKVDAFSANAYRSFVTGYGFSYIFNKACWEASQFENRDVGEDSQFVEALIQKGEAIRFAEDREGLCLHIIHQHNTSCCFPNHILPSFSLGHYFKDFTERRSEVNNSATKPKPRWGEDAPRISVCTLTHNRKQFIPLLQQCIEQQDYPLHKVEWLILDDSNEYTESLEPKSAQPITIKYQRLRHKMKLGAKRNLAHKLCSGDYIIYMDDDDYYMPSRISHAVATLIDQNAEIAGSTYLPIYFMHDQQLWLSGPFGQNHATAGTFAMTRQFAETHFYDQEAECNEEKSFLDDYTRPLAQLDPNKTMICISHSSNTFDKKRMRSGGETARMKSVQDNAAEIRSLLQPWIDLCSKRMSAHSQPDSVQ